MDGWELRLQSKDCSKFKAQISHCCKRSPQIVDLTPGAPYNQQYTNCCKGGMLASWGQDPSAAVSAFHMGVVTWNVTSTYSQFLASKNPTCCVSLSSFYKTATPCPTCSWINHTDWTLVVQHPNLSNITQVFSFEYKSLIPYQSDSEYFFTPT
ncbi:protein COBRA-like [Malania oleifera]|uniref:protein COBRA-like n=1 Tax=Malania oleifera TaxID=397392 RepID=UPI0025AE7CEF|nr:protein COBRA-like [Malania oleifera]